MKLSFVYSPLHDKCWELVAIGGLFFGGMMLKYKGVSVSFTGHRPHKFGGYDESSDLIQSIKAELKSKIEKTIEMGYTRFISGMAIGVDTWSAEIVLELKESNPDIKLICAVPFAGQDRNWPEPSKIRYKEILDQADEVVIVSEGGYSPHKMQIRNVWMVDHSNVVIAVWDGTSGGTGNCVKYAKRKKVELIHINPNEYIDDEQA